MSASVLFDAPGPKAIRRSRVTSVVGVVALLGLLGWVIYTLAAPRELANGETLSGLFDPSRWNILWEAEAQTPSGVKPGGAVFWEALLVRGLFQGTLRAAAIASVLALVIGVLFSFGRAADTRWVRVPSTIVLEFFRGMPVLLMMLFILLVFKGIGAFLAVVIALGIYNGAIIGEALRAGIQSLPKGQREAGLSIGLTPLATRLRIEFPQAFRQMLPIIIAQLVVLLKDTSLGFIVAYPELLRVGLNNLGSYYGANYMFTLFFVVLVIYLSVNLLLSWVARYVARKTGAKRPT